jgi:hypothetical protein
MEPLNPTLVDLSEELDKLGYKVVSHGDHICVRLPLFSSVRVRLAGDRFRFSPQFGPFGRSGGLLVTSGIAAGAVGLTAFVLGVAPLTLVAGFLGVVALAHDACRFVITEGALTRLQQLVATPKLLGAGARAESRQIRATK